MTPENTDLILGYYVVGYFDLLGQQDSLRDLQSLPDKTDKEALAATAKILRDTYGAVSGMRRLFDTSFEQFTRKEIDLGNLTEDQQQVYRRMNNHPIQFQGFSDSIVTYLSIRDTDDAKVHVRGILGILIAAGLTSLGLLGMGHPIRGGLDIGIGFQPTPKEIYGPALSRAYSLESEVAHYPRIVVGNTLVSYLNATAAQQPSDAYAEQSKMVAAKCIKCLAYDDDGTPFIDYLGPFFRGIVADSSGDAAVVDQAYDRVIGFSNKYKREKNSKLAFRYTLLRNYFDDRLPLWADIQRREIR